MEDNSALTRHQLLACLELGKALAAELDATRLLDTILHKVSALLPAEHWSLLRLDEATGELRFELSVDLEPSVIHNLRLRPGEGIAGQVALQQQPMMVTDVSTSPFFSTRVDHLTGFTTRAILCAPLLFGGRTLGVLEVVNPRDLDPGALHFLAAAAVPFSLLFLDIDNFKRVVDTYGHLNGTRTLQEVAALIRQCVSAPAFGVSYGGDEFVVVLPGLGKRQALNTAEEMRRTLSQMQFLANRGLQVHIEASFGVATYPEDATDRTGLLALADQAMFDVKRRGKNAVGVSDPATHR